MEDEKKITVDQPEELPAPETPKEIEAPKADVKPDVVVSLDKPAEPKTEEEAHAAAVDEMEKASQKALDAMREDKNEKNEEVVDDAQKQLEDIFNNFRTWMEKNTQPEQVKANMEDLRKRVNNLLEQTRKGVIDVADSEQFKNTMESGKQFVLGAGGMIADGLKYGYDKLMEIPEMQKAADYMDKQVDKLRSNEALKTVVEKSEEGLSDFNSKLFEGLKHFFDGSKSEDEVPAKPANLPDLPDAKDKTGE